MSTVKPDTFIPFTDYSEEKKLAAPPQTKTSHQDYPQSQTTTYFEWGTYLAWHIFRPDKNGESFKQMKNVNFRTLPKQITI